MNILLVVPINRTYVIQPPLGLGYIASMTRKNGHRIKLLDCLKEKFTFGEFQTYMKKYKYDIVGFGMKTYDLNSVKKHARITKMLSPSTITVVGGAHPSGDRQEVLKDLKEIDFAIYGEGEIAFPIFADIIEKMKKEKISKDKLFKAFAKVPNLIWRRNNTIMINPKKRIENLDKINFPAWNLMHPRSYPPAPHGAFLKSYPSAPIIITRGCPFQCTFCAGKTITGSNVRKRSVQNVLSEMEFLMKNYGVKEFLIEDENFTLHKQLVKDFCNEILSNNWIINWSCPSGVRIDELDLEMLKLMERAGCHSISIGIEFGSQRIHDLTKKRLSIKKIEQKVALFKKVNIKSTGFFLMGIPGETLEEIKKTTQFSRRLSIDRAQFNNFMPLPGSDIYLELKAKGELELNTDRVFVHDVAYVPTGLTRKQMKDIQRKAYLKFYLRHRILMGLIKEIRSVHHFFYLVKRLVDALR